MRILFLAAANSIHTVKWVNSMSNRGHEVYLLYNKGHAPHNDLINSSVKLHQLKFGGSLGYYLNSFELYNMVKKIQPDIIHVHYASGYGTLARLSKIGPIILSVWGSDVYDFPYEGKFKNQILKKNVRYADLLASTSQCMAFQLRKVMEDDSLKVRVTPFGVDVNCFDPNKYKKKTDAIVIGNIKSLNPIYGIEELIYSVRELVEDDEIDDDIKKMLRVEIYGDGDQKNELIGLISKLKLENVIYLMGKIPNNKVPEALANFDIFCALSQRESFGVSIVEAMAMEKPVVVSDVDGFKEVVEDGITGIIVDRKNVSQCKEALKKLILDETLQRQFGQNGRKRVLDLYDWEKNVSYMESIYYDFNNRPI